MRLNLFIKIPGPLCGDYKYLLADNYYFDYYGRCGGCDVGAVDCCGLFEWDYYSIFWHKKLYSKNWRRIYFICG